MKENHSQARIYFTGMFCNVFFEFYFNKLDWFPGYIKVILREENPDERVELTTALDNARKDNFEIVVYHVLGDEVLLSDYSGPFQQSRVFKKFGHILLVFTRKN